MLLCHSEPAAFTAAAAWAACSNCSKPFRRRFSSMMRGRRLRAAMRPFTMTCTRSTSTRSRMRVLCVMMMSVPSQVRRYASMPRETTERASTSRPESVSSRNGQLRLEQQQLQHFELLLFAAREANAQLAVEVGGVEVELLRHSFLGVLAELLALKVQAFPRPAAAGAQEAATAERREFRRAPGSSRTCLHALRLSGERS